MHETLGNEESPREDTEAQGLHRIPGITENPGACRESHGDGGNPRDTEGIPGHAGNPSEHRKSQGMQGTNGTPKAYQGSREYEEFEGMQARGIQGRTEHDGNPRECRDP